MGWDIVPIGLCHNIDTSNYETVAKRIADTFGTNVKCISERWVNDDIEYAELGEINISGSTHVATLEECISQDGKNRCYDIYLDFNPYPSYNPCEKVSFRIYPDILELFCVDIPFRWFSLVNPVHGLRYDRDMECIVCFRKIIQSYCMLFGCKSAVYFSDQGHGEMIWEQVALYATVPELMDFINNKLYLENQSYYEVPYHPDECVFCDLPSFCLGQSEVVPQDKALDLLFDDFHDICPMK